MKKAIFLTRSIPYVSLLGILILPLISGYLVIEELRGIKDREPVLFPLNDKNATYTIQRRGDLYTVSYHGNHWHLDDVSIATSATSLAPYDNRPIRLTGHFVRDPVAQCIVGTCHHISASVALAIERIEEAP
jgi:hypothetical protein